MMYQVIEYFTDLLDDNYAYSKGDIYPRKNYIPAPERIKQLASSENVRKRPVIQALDENISIGENSNNKENPASEPKSKKHKKKSELQDTEK